MTAQILSSELATLIQDSKRKSPDIKAAAEKSLSDLKSLPNTSEAQLAADLKKRPHFATPFILSCTSKNAKLASTAITCIQRLVVSNALAHETLREVLSGLRDCTSLAQDVQLKVLQVLPTLLQNYASLITDELLTTALQTCFMLLASKAGVISHTAAATLQQLVVSVFDKVQQEDELHTDNFILDVQIENGEISVQRSALDAHRLLSDLCLMAEGQKPEFLQAASISANLSLELIEAIFSNHAGVVTAHPEQIHVIRLKLMPFMIRALSGRLSFSTTVRSMRLLPVIFSSMLSVLATECEMVLSLLNHILEPDASVLWKRVLCMEVLRSIHSEPTLVRNIFARFDAIKGKRNIVQDQMSLMVQLASEKPAIIGLGQFSTIPATDQGEEPMDEMAALQAEGISGTIGVAVTLKASTASGISARLSSLRIACLEQLDKSDAPSIPPAYIYSLALNCLNSFSEGVARFLLPFTVPGDKSRRKGRNKDDRARSQDRESTPEPKPQLSRTSSVSNYKTPVNPLSLHKNALYDQIKTSANMVESCWPALLAAYSTFLHAALDNEYYRDLVRSFQKFTQIAGLLHLSTPRDAFLTALGKNAVPVGSNALVSGTGDSQEDEENRQSMESEATVSDRTRGSIETTRASLNSRNLLCLRALMNLGIALGPVFGKAWTIVFSTFQQADIIIEQLINARQRGRASHGAALLKDSGLTGDIGDQISAVNATAERMLESTGDLDEEAYQEVLGAICSLLRGNTNEASRPKMPSRSTTLSSPASHKRGASITGRLGIFSVDSRLDMFAVDLMSKLVHYNTSRFHEDAANKSGWNLLSKSLRQVASSQELDSNLRVKAAGVLTDIVALTASSEVFEDKIEETRLLGLRAIDDLISGIYSENRLTSLSAKDCEVEIHCMLLDTLQRVLEQCGESLTQGWDRAFSIINSVFKDSLAYNAGKESHSPRVPGSKLVRNGFGPLQLICSDFLSALPSSCQVILLSTIGSFCTQQEDFNISLTSTTLFCNVSDHLWQDETAVHLSLSADARQPTDDPQSKAGIWFTLLSSLVGSSTDERSEIRRGAIHSIFRILDANSEILTAESWVACQKSIVLPVINANQSRYQELQGSKTVDVEQCAAWNETCTMIIDNLPSLYQVETTQALQHPQFPDLWADMLKQFAALVERSDLSLSASVFSTLAKLLTELSETSVRLENHAVAVWRLWEQSNPSEHRGPPRKAPDNQVALLAYARCFGELYPLASNALATNEVRSSLIQLRECVAQSSPTSYPGDVESLTPLQDQVIQCLKLIKTEQAGHICQVGTALSFFSSMAQERFESDYGSKGPTFVAFSKASIGLLAEHITDHATVKEIYSQRVLEKALESLGESIRVKYAWNQQGKDPQIWKRATQATTDILGATLPQWDTQSAESSIELIFWKTILQSCSYIISAPDESASDSQKPFVDQEFDITRFLELWKLIIPRIATNLQEGSHLEMILANNLLQSSFVHEPHPDDIPHSDEIAHPLMALTSEHIGRTDDLAASSRARMSYTVTDKLFELVAVATEFPETQLKVRKRLATAAAPYFILRAGISLKSYVLDQPLRGRIPQPASQRKELLYLLQRLATLDSDPDAFESFNSSSQLDANSSKRFKRHLFVLYPFVVQALAVTQKDDELRNALTNILNTLSTEFDTQGKGFTGISLGSAHQSLEMVQQ